MDQLWGVLKTVSFLRVPCNPMTGASRAGRVALIRSELVQTIARKNPHLSVREVERIVTTIFDAVIEQLATGGRVELRGFGAFSTRARTARTGRNPRTGDQVEVAAKRVPYFKPGKEMRARLNV